MLPKIVDGAAVTYFVFDEPDCAMVHFALQTPFAARDETLPGRTS